MPEGYYSYIDHSIRYLLKTPEGYVTSIKKGVFQGFTDDARKAGAFTKELLLPYADKIKSGIYDAVLWGSIK